MQTYWNQLLERPKSVASKIKEEIEGFLLYNLK
jgi:hypothetical protein